MPIALFFFFRIASVIRGLLWFHTDFKIFFSVSVNNRKKQIIISLLLYQYILKVVSTFYLNDKPTGIYDKNCSLAVR